MKIPKFACKEITLQQNVRHIIQMIYNLSKKYKEIELW
jgi:hypothetical protein